MVNRHHLKSADQGGLGRVARSDGDTTHAPTDCRLGHRQGTWDRPDPAVESELAGEHISIDDPARELPGGREERGGDRQIKARPGLAQVGRREVDRDPLLRIAKARVDQRRADPLPRLPDRRVRQPDDGERRQARADVDLHVDGLGRHPDQREGPGDREHGATVGRSDSRLARGTSRSRDGFVTRRAPSAARPVGGCPYDVREACTRSASRGPGRHAIASARAGASSDATYGSPRASSTSSGSTDRPSSSSR